MTTDLPGFTDPVADAQACFRAVLDAMAQPGRICQAGAGLRTPAPLHPATGAVLLTLADADTPVWLDTDAATASDWLRFHCGTPFVSPDVAAIAVCLALPDLGTLHWGSHDGPETGATVILQCPALEAGPRLRLSGPGLRDPTTVRLGMPANFVDLWRANHAAFPRGIDLIVCSGTQVAGLPRSICVEPA